MFEKRFQTFFALNDVGAKIDVGVLGRVQIRWPRDGVFWGGCDGLGHHDFGCYGSLGFFGRRGTTQGCQYQAQANLKGKL